MGKIGAKHPWVIRKTGHHPLKQWYPSWSKTLLVCALYGGKKYLQLYNDGFRPILGSTKHPQALGNSAADTYHEIWDTIEPMFQKVMRGESVSETDFMVPLNRNEFAEECYFDFSYSPVRKEDGEPGGILITVIETTAKKKAEEEFKDSRERMEYATHAADIATWVFDPQNETFNCDPLLRNWFGLPEGKSSHLNWQWKNWCRKTGNLFKRR